ncbi:MAG: CaiB/BaiF CoA transferase family protein [Janthinobacterium lividum]
MPQAGQGGHDLPLAGVRVLDLVVGPVAAVGRLLGELGADIIRVEPRAGAPDRHAGIMAVGVSLDFVAANLGKRAVALDLDNDPDRRRFDGLVATADILIENTRPGSNAAALLDVAAIRNRHPALVVLSVSDFGQSGRFSRWQVTGPVLHALTGELSRSGIPGRAPLLPPGDLPYDCAVPQAAFVTLVAYLNRLQTGLGDHLDLSLLDAAGMALDPGYGIAGSATAGVPASRLPRGRPEARHQYPIIPCKDGHVRICVLAPRQWQGMFEWMGRPDEFADPSYRLIQTRFASKTLIPAIAKLFAVKTRQRLEEEGQRHGVPTAAVLDRDEALQTEQIRARRVFVPVEIAPGVTAPFPDGVIELDGRRAGVRGTAPALGQHQDATFAETGPAATGPATDPGGRPLDGLAVLDFGVIVVGAEQGRLLADQGADVIKVETPAFPDGSRQDRSGGIMSPTFAAGHRNKSSLGLDLRHPDGKALLLRLVERTDVILSNFKAGTLASLGLDHPTLSAVTPGIIVVDSSAFGPTGPWSRRLGYGPLVRASAGLTAQWSYPGEPETFSDAITVYPDHVAGRIGCIGVLALLIRRRRTGAGGSVSISQAEVMLSHMAPQIAAATLRAEGVATSGGPDAPWGVFPCIGDDEWCVVTVRDDADWHALCAVIDRRDLSEDPVLADAAGRADARQRIDAALLEWLATRLPVDAMETLQAAGVPAGAMLRVIELPTFPYYAERGLFQAVTHPHLANPLMLETAPVHAGRLLDPEQRPAPLMGEQTDEILRLRLGLSHDEIERLAVIKVIERPPALPHADTPTNRERIPG